MEVKVWLKIGSYLATSLRVYSCLEGGVGEKVG